MDFDKFNDIEFENKILTKPDIFTMRRKEKIMINCGIIGAGNIATDLMLKILKNKDFNLVCIFGRNNSSPGVKIAKKKCSFLHK